MYLDAAADHILGLKWHMRSHFQLHVAPSQPEHAIQAEGCSVAAVQLILADLLPGYEEAAEPSLAASLADPLAQNDWQLALQLRCALHAHPAFVFLVGPLPICQIDQALSWRQHRAVTLPLAPSTLVHIDDPCCAVTCGTKHWRLPAAQVMELQPAAGGSVPHSPMQQMAHLAVQPVRMALNMSSCAETRSGMMKAALEHLLSCLTGSQHTGWRWQPWLCHSLPPSMLREVRC